MEPITITSFEAENVKRIRAVSLTPAPTGLTVIGGKNGQGKTSVLHGIAYALGGSKYRPGSYQRTGSSAPAHLKITLSNGLIVERKGENGSLKITDPSGRKGGQKLLDAFVETFAINLPAFMSASDKEKAGIMLNILGIGEQLAQLEHQEQEIYNERRYVGQDRDRKKAHAEELPGNADGSTEEISAADLIRRQQSILAKNAENQRSRDLLDKLIKDREATITQIAQLEAQLEAAQQTADTLAQRIEAGQKTVAELRDESTAELEESIQRVDEINTAARQNAAKKAALEEAAALSSRYDEMSSQLAGVRNQRTKLLEEADLPLPGLSVENGVLHFKGQPWDCMSGAEQLISATAIVRRLKPACGFVLLDKLEQLDSDTLSTFGKWLQQEGLQAIATRVSTGDECSIIIEDGEVLQPQKPVQTDTTTTTPTTYKAWTKGAF